MIQAAPVNISYELDEFNSRIKLLGYNTKNLELLLSHINDLAEENDIGKVIIYADKEDIGKFTELGFEQEGEISNFFNGDPACILSLFLQKKTLLSKG